MGIDLLKEKRPFIFFNGTGDNKIGVINSEWLMYFLPDQKTYLHRYKLKDKTNYANEYPKQVNKMKEYAQAHLQTYQTILNKK